MITKKKVVLLANGIEIADLRYEAIEIIVDIGRIEEIWAKNKTPLLLKGQMKKMTSKSWRPMRLLKFRSLSLEQRTS